MTRRLFPKILVALGLWQAAGRLQAACLGALSGPVKVSVLSCQVVNPSTYFAAPGQLPAWFQSSQTPQQAAATLRTYEGVLIRGVVRESTAVDTGLNDHSALFGQEITFFSGVTPASCQTFQPGVLVGAQLQRICCENDVTVAPCLLKTDLLGGSAIPTVLSGVGTAERGANYAADLRRARELMIQEKLSEALVILEGLEKQGNLPPHGYYMLGLAYYAGPMDYRKAAMAFERVRLAAQRADGKEIDKEVRHAVFMLARCYAILKETDHAGVILEEMLAEPYAYREEIALALRHEDFGWINTSKEYQSFVQRARNPAAAKKRP